MSQVIANGGKAPKVADTHVVVLYEADTGRIAHMHTVTVFEGGRPVSEAEAVDEAVTQASRSGCRTGQLKIKVSKDADHGRRPHRIDLASGEIVAVPRGSRKRQSGGG